MNRDKQIEDMASVICKASSNRGECQKCVFFKYKSCFKFEDANNLYNAGYRKASDVAREIFAEIDTMIFGTIIPNDCAIISTAKLAELKKKYESEGADDEQS